ncbi:phage tail tape measure protein [Rahnella bruchi]|uniref:phage tail tape measure protein n=3 Tax=Rahnella TaxID=34037 RepID=UPI000EA2C220|nr:phage tail tape measure protein [Rahnella bruchi]
MSNLRLQVLLNAVDRASRPFRSVEKASKALSGNIRNTQDTLRNLNAQASQIDGFRKASAQLAVTRASLKKAKEEASRLSQAFANTANPTAKQTRLMEAAKRAASELQAKENSLRNSVQRQRGALESAGISTRNLAAEQRRLRASSQEANATLARQREELARLNRQQQRRENSRRRFQATQRAGDTIRNNGAVAMGVGSAALYAEGKFIAPGITFDKEMSGTQAILGLDKTDKKLAAIRQQARDIGGSTAFSPMDVARTQGVLARSGYNADSILSSTESTVNLSLASGIDIADAADIVTNMQSAFNIPMDQIKRVSDVMTKGFTSSNTNLIELGEAMKYVAPIAQAAGASIEDTTAMLGVLADNGIKGSMAGTGASAMFSRLQAPTGQSPAALKELGISTRDKKGNMLPIQKILTDINASFKRNKLGTAQQAEYLKVIFGEEAMKGAVKLVEAAGNGRLTEKKTALENSRGSAASVAKVQTDNLDGDLKNMQSAFEDLQIETFDKQDSSLRKLTQSATDWLGNVGKWVKANPKLTGTIVKSALAVTSLVVGLGVLGVVVGPVVKGLGYIGMALKGVGTALLWMGRAAMANPLLAVVALIAMAAIYIWANWSTLEPKFKKMWDAIAAWTTEAWATITDWLTGTWNSIVAGVQGLSDKFAAVWTGIKDGAKAGFAAYIDFLKSFGQKIFDVVKSLPGKFKEAGSNMITALMDGIAAKWQTLKDKLSSMTDFLPDWMKSDGDKTISVSVSNSLPKPAEGLSTSALPAPILPKPAGGLNTAQPYGTGGAAYNYAGMFDKGGDIAAGEVGIVGENGAELVRGPVSVTGRRDTSALMRNQAPAAAPTFNVYAAPGQSAKDVAAEAMRLFEDYMRRQRSAARSSMNYG